MNFEISGPLESCLDNLREADSCLDEVRSYKDKLSPKQKELILTLESKISFCCTALNKLLDDEAES